MIQKIKPNRAKEFTKDKNYYLQKKLFLDTKDYLHKSI